MNRKEESRSLSSLVSAGLNDQDIMVLQYIKGVDVID